jgi:hypothetical protein
MAANMAPMAPTKDPERIEAALVPTVTGPVVVALEELGLVPEEVYVPFPEEPEPDPEEPDPEDPLEDPVAVLEPAVRVEV